MVQDCYLSLSLLLSSQFLISIKMEKTPNSIDVYPLGAGQDVGRSCVIVTLKDKKIMFDTGIHMLYSDQRRYPAFEKLLKPGENINKVINLVIVTHFHLDHCGALPYLTQFHKYSGPLYASTPTKAMIPYMLQDFRKVTMDVKKQEVNFTQNYYYTQQDIKSSTQKIKSIGLNQTIYVDGIKITSFYAGHVLGAAMFYVQYGGLSALYTGDYNSYADRHLGAAYVNTLNPNIIITQTTYATTIRDTKRDRQRKMLKIISETLQAGGKVLIPVFALGRAQQLSVLLQTYWNRTDNDIPIYFSAGLIEKANFYYKIFVEWENQKIKQSFLTDHIFQFKKVKPFDKALIRADGPYVLFATPGMLHGGTSMQVFKQWCGDEKNTLIIPGYCVPGTLGNKLLSGVKQINVDKKLYDVKMRIQNISFSAHADAKGIINLIRHLNPESIVFVHGDKQKMEVFKQVVEEQLKKRVYMPANHELITIPITPSKQITVPFEQGQLSYGYILKNPQTNKYQLVQQDDLLKQLNLTLDLLGEKNHLFVESEVCCQVKFPTNKIRSYQQLEQFNLKIKSQSQKSDIKAQIKRQQKMQQETNKIKIVGNLSNLTKFISAISEK